MQIRRLAACLLALAAAHPGTGAQVASCDLPASVTPLDGAGNVPASLTANGVPTVGNSLFEIVAQDPTDACDVAAVTPVVLFITLQPPLNIDILLPWGCFGGTAEVLVNPLPFDILNGLMAAGGNSTFSVPIPFDDALCGVPFWAQVAFSSQSGSPLLGTALECVMGT